MNRNWQNMKWHTLASPILRVDSLQPERRRCTERKLEGTSVSGRDA